MRIAAEGDRVLLLSRRGKQSIVTLHAGERLHTHRGMIEHAALIGVPYGSATTTHTGELLYIMRPSIHDELMAIRRASQVIYPKELGEILLRLNLRQGARVIEAGTGSGAMTMAFAHALQPDGHVYSYDLRPDMLSLARQNLERVGLQKMVEFVERDISEGFVHDQADALFLDVRDPVAVLSAAAQALAGGGHLGILVPTANQIIALLEALEGSMFIDVDVLEILHRHYKPVSGRLRPEDTMVGHTGYLLFARRIWRAPRAEQVTVQMAPPDPSIGDFVQRVMLSAPPLPRFTVADGVASAEIVVKNSVFVGTVAPARDEPEARAQVEQVRKRYPDANHHAWAYIIIGGPQAEIGSSDDGEPGGTAGRPMLAVLQGRGILQTVAIGTRYFGGVKLGTGGLARAYSDCIRQALTGLPVAEMVYYHRAKLAIPYPLYGTLKHTLPQYGVTIDDETFAEEVHLTLSIPPTGLDPVAHLLGEATNGQVRLSEHLSGGHYVKTRL